MGMSCILYYLFLKFLFYFYHKNLICRLSNGMMQNLFLNHKDFLIESISTTYKEFLKTYTCKSHYVKFITFKSHKSMVFRIVPTWNLSFISTTIIIYNQCSICIINLIEKVNSSILCTGFFTGELSTW